MEKAKGSFVCVGMSQRVRGRERERERGGERER